MGHPIHKHMSGRAYDAKEAYNKDLSDSARLHYLENDEHDKGMSRNAAGNAAGMVPGVGSVSDAQNAAIAKKRSAAKTAAGMIPGAGSIPDAPNSRNSSPANNVSYGDISGKTGYIGEQREDLMKYNAVDDRAGMSRHSNYGNSPANGIFDTIKKVARTGTRAVGDIGTQALDMLRPDHGSDDGKRRPPGATSYGEKVGQKRSETDHFQKSRDLTAQGKTYFNLSSAFDDDGEGGQPTQSSSYGGNGMKRQAYGGNEGDERRSAKKDY